MTKPKTDKKNESSEVKTYTLKIKKIITLTAFIDQTATHQDQAYDLANIKLEREVTEKLLRKKNENETMYNFLIDNPRSDSQETEEEV